MTVADSPNFLSITFTPDNGEAEQQDLALGDRVRQLIDVDQANLTQSESETLVSELRALDLPGRDQAGFISVNRLLLESLLPAMIQPKQDTSTWIVPIYDQRTRKRYLILWMLLTLVGTIGGFGPHRVATVFQFYRKQLADNFLVRTTTESPSADPPHSIATALSGDGYLSDLHPEQDGLPYPLILAAALEPAHCNGSYHVRATPFLFSPLYSGDFNQKENDR